MTKYNVHIYREMRLRFDGIEAASPQDAAEEARSLSLKVADELDECDGETFAALVDVDGDEDFAHSISIDFEPQRMLNAATKLLAYAVCEAAIACGKADPRYDPFPILRSHGWNKESESAGLFLSRIRREAIEGATGSYLGRSAA